MAKKAPGGATPKKGSAPEKTSARKKAVSPAEKSGRRKLGEAPEPVRTGMLDGRTRRNIAAIALVVCAVALFLIVVIPSDAVVASFLSLCLHKGLGIGAYLLPLFLLASAFAFTARSGMRHASGRIMAGLAVLFFGVLVLLALASPGAVDSSGASADIFADRNTFTHGGLVGAGVAFVLIMLLGFPVAVIIGLGIVAVGLAIVGFSVRKVLAAALARHQEAMARREEELSVMPDAPYIPMAAASPRTRSMARPQPTSPDASASQATQLIAEDADGQRRASFPFADDLGFEPIPEPTFENPFNPTVAFEPLPPITPDDVPRKQNARLSANLEGGRRDPREALGESRTLTRRLGRSSHGFAGGDDQGASEPEVEIPDFLKAPADASEPEETPAASATRTRKPAAQAAASAPKGSDDAFRLPPLSLLRTSGRTRRNKGLEEELAATAEHLQQTMESFGIPASVVDWIAGPTVTLFEIDLPPGVRVSRLMALKDDIALALAAPGVRIFAPIPKTHYVGVEVPNAHRENVLLGDILKKVSGGPLEVAIGKDVEGNPIIEDLARMPHLLIGGTTGSGKSVGINAMIMSIIMRATPSQVRFIMIDPKRVEFAPYDGIPHLYVPVVTDPKEAASALSWGVAEMDLRLKTFEGARVRNISSYNELAASGELRQRMEEGQLEEGKIKHPQFIDEPMPYIVIVIDELADLMMNVGKEVEFSISRIAQLARAAGIHLIVATQRPSANVVTGLIKANITTRIAYNVASGLDSRVILDTTGAESLIGLGDLLISKPEYGKPLRVQGCFTSDEEIAAVVDAIKAQGEPEYHSEILKTNLITLGNSAPDGSGGTGGADDPLLWEAAEIVVSSGLGSTSNIQRKLKVGYARAGRIMDMLEEKDIVGPPNGSKPREVLLDAMDLEALKAIEMADA